MSELASFQRLTLRIVLLKVSPLVARLISVPDDLSLDELHPASVDLRTLWPSIVEQGKRFDSDTYRLRDGAVAQPAVAQLRVPTCHDQDLPSVAELVAWADQPGIAVPGTQVGLVDSVWRGSPIA